MKAKSSVLENPMVLLLLVLFLVAGVWMLVGQSVMGMQTTSLALPTVSLANQAVEAAPVVASNMATLTTTVNGQATVATMEMVTYPEVNMAVALLPAVNAGAFKFESKEFIIGKHIIGVGISSCVVDMYYYTTEHPDVDKLRLDKKVKFGPDCGIDDLLGAVWSFIVNLTKNYGLEGSIAYQFANKMWEPLKAALQMQIADLTIPQLQAAHDTFILFLNGIKF